MIALQLFVWWYGQGWSQAAKNTQKMLTGISRAFSVPILLRTLFAPWRRIITYPGSSLETKIRAFEDNIVSRAVGLVVRLLVLLTAFLTILSVLVLGVLSIVLWPLIPLAAVLLLIKGIIG